MGKLFVVYGLTVLSRELIQIEKVALRWPESIYKFTEANVFPGYKKTRQIQFGGQIQRRS